jgi:hypothetical protein
VGTVLASAWFVALALALGLRAGRRGLLLGLASGPIVGLFWIGFAAQENTVTREDRVVLIVACILGSSLAVAPIAYARWVRWVFRDTNQRIRLH